MAIYSTFFVCELEQLVAAFPGWRLPLSQPVTRTSKNPFTRQEMTYETRAPAWEDDVDQLAPQERIVVASEGNYETYLERRIPTFVQSQPHWCAKNLTSVELEPLVAAVTDLEEPTIDTPLYAHPSLSAGIEKFPDLFLERLKSADTSELHVLAQEWATEMSSPDFTHSEDGERVEDDWTAEDALSILTPISNLAKEAKSGQSLFLLNEW
ncbi:MAG: hypothetical protein ACKVP0_21775 [Pirellulaceae bacterium]